MQVGRGPARSRRREKYDEGGRRADCPYCQGVEGLALSWRVGGGHGVGRRELDAS